MYSRILVPLDGSHLSETVIPYARTLAFGLDATIELLHVVDPGTLADADSLASAMASAEAYLASVAANLPKVESLTLSGAPAEAIAARAAAHPDSLVAMSSHGHTGVRRMVLGSTTDKVLRSIDQPLLLVKGEDETPRVGQASIDAIFLALDGSAASEEAMPTAVELAKRLSVPLEIIRVVPPVMDYYTPGADSLAGMVDVTGAVEQEAQDYLTRVAASATALGVASVRTAELLGFPAAKLVDVAEANPHGLMVMGTHGRTGLGRSVLGSVSDRLARDSSQPVLLIRPE